MPLIKTQAEIDAEEMRVFSENLSSIMTDIRKGSLQLVNSVRSSVAATTFAASALADALSDACILVSETGIVLSTNKQAKSVFCGVSTGTSLEDLVKTFNPHQSIKDGEWVLYRVNEIPEYFDVSTAKTAAGTLYILRDVTAKKRLEFQALDVSAFQQTLVRSMPALVFYANSEGKHLRGSDMFMCFMGWSRTDALSKTLKDIVGNDMADHLLSWSVGEARVEVPSVSGVTKCLIRKSTILDAGASTGFIYVLETANDTSRAE